MSKTYRPYQPTQSFLLPPLPLDWLPEDHLDRFVLDTVGELDLSEILGYYEREARGYPPHHPMMRVAVLLYTYCGGVPSSRTIEKRTHEDVAFRVLAGNTHPDHTRISEFRRIHLKALTKLFVQVLRLCQKMGLGEDRAQEEAQAEAVVGEMNNIRVAQNAGARPDDKDPPPSGAPTTVPEPIPEHQIPINQDGTPTAKAQRNFTDADSRIMKTGDGFMQGYNAQAAVDEAHQIIVAADVSNQSPDAEHLVPMLDETIDNCGAVPDKMSADTGYFSEANVLRAKSRGVDPYIATKRQKHGAAADPTESLIPSDESDAKAQMKKKLSTPEGAKVYSRRKVIVEPAFGQIKNRGFRGFLLRGIEKVRGEWSLITLTHNLLKLHKATRRGPAVGTCAPVAN